MGNVAKNKRLVRKWVEERGHEVLGVERLAGTHGKLRVRLRDGREVLLPFACSHSKGESVARNYLTMQLRALERGLTLDGRRDFDPS